MRSKDPERAKFAFYSADAPGSGVEIWFLEYEGFALVLGLKLMAHGWSQSFAVSVMRRVRLELEKQHARVLALDEKKLFDKEAIRRGASEGDFAFDNRDPVLLTIVSKPGAKPDEQREPHACAVCRGPQAALKFAWDSGRGWPWTMLEIIAHAFSQRLARTEPRHRGRA